MSTPKEGKNAVDALTTTVAKTGPKVPFNNLVPVLIKKLTVLNGGGAVQTFAVSGVKTTDTIVVQKISDADAAVGARAAFCNTNNVVSVRLTSGPAVSNFDIVILVYRLS